MKFFLGTHQPNQKWFDLDVPLFISNRTLYKRKSFPTATCGWALDSGGFSELSMFGEWQTSPRQYIKNVARYRDIGCLLWVAPQDWMCEPFILEKTGLTLEEHQRRTVGNYLLLEWHLGEEVIPVLQGWQLDDYHRCWEMYEQAGVNLEECHTVGVGSVCRRQKTQEAADIFRSLLPLQMHGFGVKTGGLKHYADCLVSSDSMAWSFAARRAAPLPGCLTHINCANCPIYAMQWRDKILNQTGVTA